MSDTDVVIVGGGLGGLACATLLAKRGVRVTIVERKRELGGRAASHVEGGFVFDQGPHALYRGGPAERLLRELGVPLEGRAPSAAGSLAIDEGILRALPVGLGTLLASDLLPLRGKLEGALFLARMGGARPEESVAELVQRTFTDDSTRRFVHALVRLTTYTNAPDQLRASFALAVLARVTKHNVLYLHGGWQSLVDALARSSGGEVLRGEAELVFEGDDVTGVRVHDAVLRPKRVVLAMGARAAHALAPRETIDAEPVHAAVLQLGLTRLPEPSRAFALGIDEPLYFSVPSLTARYAPEGCFAINVAEYLPQNKRGDEAKLERALDLVQPGWRAHVRARRFLPNLVVASAIPGRGAAAARTRNLSFVGDWLSRDHHLLDAVMESARAAADEVSSGSVAAA